MPDMDVFWRDGQLVVQETTGGPSVLVCEAHPDLGWPHGSCAGPGCGPDYRAEVLRDALTLLRVLAAYGDADAAAWLDRRGIDHGSGT